MERNFFEKLVRENFRFGRMCRDRKSAELKSKSTHRTWNRESTQRYKEDVQMCCRLSAGI